MWGWVTAYIVLEMGLLNLSGISGGGGWEAVTIMQPFLAGLLFTGLAFSAADSLREERETGALELLLVTPLTVRKVILGRLFGLWGQYLPAFLAILFTWFYVISADSAVSSTLRTVVRHGWTLVLFSSFLTLPVIGLRQSLHRRHFLTAWMLTLGLGLVGTIGAHVAEQLAGRAVEEVVPALVRRLLRLERKDEPTDGESRQESGAGRPGQVDERTGRLDLL
jgi:ABC-type transport system involved in cytochrome c biogenesis permease component